MSEIPYPPAYLGHKTTEANLVLEGGAMRGIFTAGVLDFFMDKGLFCERVIGVSAGALLGYNYVAGARGRGCLLNLKYCDDPRYLSLHSYLTTGNAFGREFSFDELPNEIEPFDYGAFNASPMKLTTVASDLVTGEADYREIADARDDIPYLIASSSMPLVSQIVEVDGKKLLDGGTCDSIPIIYSKTTGARKHIVVCTREETYRKGPNKVMALMRARFSAYPYFLERAESRHFEYNRTYRLLSRMHEAGEAFVIHPPEPIAVSNMEHDRDKLFALYLQGVETAARAWPDLVSYLER